jgi:O-antigen ligase
MLSTGSRGAFVSAALTLAVVTVVSRPKIKVAILLGIPLVGLIALPLVPSKSVERLASLFRSSENDTTDATASRMARQRLLEQSIALTLSHPVFGVGPGEFMDSEGSLAKASGERGMWHETHNTYTQISSECGIPAFLCYVGALFLTLKRLWKAGRNSDPIVATVARVVFTSSFGFAVAFFFLSHAYDFPVLVSGGLSIAIDQLLAGRANEASSPAPVELPAVSMVAVPTTRQRRFGRQVTARVHS